MMRKTVVLLFSFACSRPAAPSDAGVVADATVKSEPVDTVTAASPSWEAGAPVVAKGEVDGNALRERNRKRIAADKSAVTLLRGGTPEELGNRICEASVPKRAKETPILIKPNIGGFEWFKDGADDGLKGRITDPEFVRGIVKCLKNRGHDHITIAEGWGATHKDWEHLVKASGYGAMAKEENVKLVAMDDDGVFDVEGDQPGKPYKVKGMEKTHAPTLLMAKVLAEHLNGGLFISAPKVKAHRFGVTSMSIKGGQGVVMLSDASPAFHQKWRMHKELSAALKLIETDEEAGKKAYLASLDVFAERMTDVLEVAAPDVVLAEGAPAEGGDGFGKRWPTTESVAIGGTNPILVDRIGAQFLGLWDNADLAKELGGHRTSPLIEKAAKRFGVDIASPALEGDGKALLDKPRPTHFVAMSGFSIHTGGAPPATSDKPTLHAPKIDALSMDGVRETAWDAATPVSFDTAYDGTVTKIHTTVRAAWNKDALYMLWELADASLNTDVARPVRTEREKLYEEDCVEIFLGPKSKYYEIELGPFGHFFDLSVTNPGRKSDTEWSSGATIGAKQDREKKTATIEVKLSSADIVAMLGVGRELPLGLYRIESKNPRTYLAWSPPKTKKPDFHVPEAFGTLVLE